MVSRPVLVSVSVGDEPQRWIDAGFSVDGASSQVGKIRIDLGGAGTGITAWSLRDVEAGPLDGLDTRRENSALGSGAVHPNGTVALDHLVITSHDPMRTRSALEARGFEVRRTVEMGDRRYTFFRVGEAILELVGPAAVDGDGPARLYGLAFTVDDLDATAAFLGPLLGRVKEAVQPGRRIATLQREAGLSVPVAFMSRDPDQRPS